MGDDKALTLRPNLKLKRLEKKLRFGLGANCVGSVLQILSSSFRIYCISMGSTSRMVSSILQAESHVFMN